jgi:hypothetical protein
MPRPLILAGWFTFFLAATACPPALGQDQSPDNLRVYAVNVVKKAPLEKQFTGYGIYLGKGMVLTAAHVVGNFPNLTHPRVLIAGRDLPATLAKQGSLDTIDLALLSVDETQLPASLQLRQNPLCKVRPPIGAQVAVIYPERSVTSHIISPLLIAPRYRARLGSLITEPQGSGAGVFDADRHCLLGIISMKVQKYAYRKQGRQLMASPAGYAGYYVPASAIAAFIPAELRF